VCLANCSLYYVIGSSAVFTYCYFAVVLLYLGRDCIGCAKTGSGKTAAFALPILQKLCEDPYGIFALVLSPTRCVAAVS